MVDVAVTPEFVSLRVTDNGPGIAADVLPQVFDKFVRARSATKPEGGEGTGLGLAIAKAMVEKMGGGIRFESERGRGATFYVDLPIARP